jgi:hypothetical protein
MLKVQGIKVAAEGADAAGIAAQVVAQVAAGRNPAVD